MDKDKGTEELVCITDGVVCGRSLRVLGRGLYCYYVSIHFSLRYIITELNKFVHLGDLVPTRNISNEKTHKERREQIEPCDSTLVKSACVLSKKALL